MIKNELTDAELTALIGALATLHRLAHGDDIRVPIGCTIAMSNGTQDFTWLQLITTLTVMKNDILQRRKIQ